MEELLEEAEKTLYFISCAVPLVRSADYDRFGAEIDCILETVEQMASSAREKISNELILMHIERKRQTKSHRVADDGYQG